MKDIKTQMLIALLGGNLNGFERLNTGMQLSQQDVQDEIDIIRLNLLKLKEHLEDKELDKKEYNLMGDYNPIAEFQNIIDSIRK